MKNLWYLVAAYSAVWAVVAAYLVVLLRRNKRLNDTITQLEERLNRLENSSRE